MIQELADCQFFKTVPRGEKRAGGRPKGSKDKHPRKGRIEALTAAETIRTMVAAKIGQMTEAQIAAATGYRHLVARDRKGGKFKPITAAEVERLNDPEMVAEIWEKHPSPEAYRNLLDRAMGRPVETLQADLNLEAGPKLAILLANLKRVGNGHG